MQDGAQTIANPFDPFWQEQTASRNGPSGILGYAPPDPLTAQTCLESMRSQSIMTNGTSDPRLKFCKVNRFVIAFFRMNSLELPITMRLP